jgi:Ni/Co efflux regulator RcnB
MKSILIIVAAVTVVALPIAARATAVDEEGRMPSGLRSTSAAVAATEAWRLPARIPGVGRVLRRRRGHADAGDTADRPMPRRLDNERGVLHAARGATMIDIDAVGARGVAVGALFSKAQDL